MKTSMILCYCLINGSAAIADTHYVDINNAAPSVPYTSWATAATSIQSAVWAASSSDTVLVNDGTYVDNIYVNKDILISSVNGPEVTIVDGAASWNVFEINATDAVVAGFTITNGYDYFNFAGGGMYGGTASNCIFISNYSEDVGGGMAYGTAYNCTFVNNSAFIGGGAYEVEAYNCKFFDNIVEAHTTSNDGYGGFGGGMAYGTAYNCLFSGNRAEGSFYWGGAGGGPTYPVVVGGAGGGLFESTAYNCTIVGNTAEGPITSVGGGICDSFAYNSIIYYNYADDMANYYPSAFHLSHCCTPYISEFEGNINDEPLFVDKDAGNYCLTTNSPCINAGYNGSAPTGTDMDGNPRVLGGTVDMGAYEYYLGYVIDCYPVDSGFSLEWIANESWNVVVQYSTNVVEMPFADLSDSLAYPLNSFTDTVHSAESECFYRVEMVP